ncbi:MAG: NYN domain-containing protein [Patescibacteria group bacterium]
MKHKDQRVGIFIDTQNMYYSARFLFKRKVDFKHIVEDGVAGRKLIRAIAYVIKTKDASEQPFFDALEKSGIELRSKDLIEFASGHKKGDWDVGLTIDVVRMLDMLDVIVLVSGDGDYGALVQFAQAHGRIVELISFGETTSSTLAEMVDDRIDMSQSKNRYLIGPAVKSPKYEKPVYNDEPETLVDESSTTDESEEKSAQPGFFMESKENEDQQDMRDRRLEF